RRHTGVLPERPIPAGALKPGPIDLRPGPALQRVGDGGHHLELGHHAVVLVFQVVAVDHVAAVEVGELDDHADGLVLADGHGVLPTGLRFRRRAAVAVEDLEHVEVDVDGVGHHRAVLEPPDLGRAQPRGGVDTGRIEGLPVDGPAHAVHAVHAAVAVHAPVPAHAHAHAEDEVPGGHRRSLVESLEGSQLGGNGRRVALLAGDVEEHDLPRPADLGFVAEDHLG